MIQALGERISSFWQNFDFKRRIDKKIPYEHRFYVSVPDRGLYPSTRKRLAQHWTTSVCDSGTKLLHNNVTTLYLSKLAQHWATIMLQCWGTIIQLAAINGPTVGPQLAQLCTNNGPTIMNYVPIMAQLCTNNGPTMYQ